MSDDATDPVEMGDLPFDDHRKYVPPPFAPVGSSLSKSQQRARRWRHRIDFLKQELASHMLAFWLFLFVVGYFVFRYLLQDLLRHIHHPH